MTDSFKFSTTGQNQDEAFALYQTLYANGSDVTRSEGPFHAEVRAWRLDKILLFDRQLSGVIHARGDRVASDGFDHFVLTHVLDGELHLHTPTPARRICAGETVLLDTLRPMRTDHRQAHILTASVARDVIAAALGPTPRLHGQVLKPPGNLVLADFLASLARRGDDLAPAALPALCRAFIDILASVGADEPRPGREDQRRDLARRETVERFIAAHVSNRALSVDSISAGTGISRSSLYRLFDKQGGVARFILTHRLDSLRTTIDNGDRTPLAELAAAFGFTSETTMSRLFAEAHGMSPQTYRQALLERDRSDPLLSKRRWAGWMKELE